VKALSAAERYVVVRNRMEDLYTRAWCLVEYIYAKKFGFYKDKVLVTGPNEFSASRTTCTEIQASDEEDRLKIFKFIMDEGGPAVIDPQIHEFRAFDARFGGIRIASDSPRNEDVDHGPPTEEVNHGPEIEEVD